MRCFHACLPVIPDQSDQSFIPLDFVLSSLLDVLVVLASIACDGA